MISPSFLMKRGKWDKKICFTPRACLAFLRSLIFLIFFMTDHFHKSLFKSSPEVLIIKLKEYMNYTINMEHCVCALLEHISTLLNENSHFLNYVDICMGFVFPMEGL